MPALTSQQIKDLLLGLQGSPLPVAKTAESLLSSGHLTSDVSSLLDREGIAVMRTRVRVKVTQLARSQDATERSRLTEIHAALLLAISWIDQDSTRRLRVEVLHGEPDLAFIIYRNDMSGEIISGFESRNSRTLTLERGREFWGSSWRPPLDPGI
jgi:hypothetical protein